MSCMHKPFVVVTPKGKKGYRTYVGCLVCKKKIDFLYVDPYYEENFNDFMFLSRGIRPMRVTWPLDADADLMAEYLDSIEGQRVSTKALDRRVP